MLVMHPTSNRDQWFMILLKNESVADVLLWHQKGAGGAQLPGDICIPMVPPSDWHLGELAPGLEHPCKERAPAPWDHMDLRLERCGCEGEKGRPWEHGLASIQCSVLDTGESSRLLGSRTPAQALVVTLMSCLNCHKSKNYLERKCFKMF